MNEHKPISIPNEYTNLAQWLKQVLARSPQPKTRLPSKGDDHNQLEMLLDSDYHLPYYQQLPDFAMALLNDDRQVAVDYAPLLYHLVGCPDCHRAYLDIYDALRAAIQLGNVSPTIGQVARPLSTPSARMLVLLSKALISQAEAVLLQARRDHADEDELARSLLRLAITVSSRIAQHDTRNRALQDLVRVATLFDGPTAPETDPTLHAYSPSFTGAAGHRGVKRRIDTSVRSARTPSEEQVIYLQSDLLGGHGTIVQAGDTLELHLQDVDETLRGQYLTISVPLGSLIEPVRWRGGNPKAIRSVAPVDEQGELQTPLGQTDLQLSKQEERSLLEVIFSLLQVRAAS